MPRIADIPQAIRNRLADLDERITKASKERAALRAALTRLEKANRHPKKKGDHRKDGDHH